MKKIIGVVALFFAVVLLAGCGKDKKESVKEKSVDATWEYEKTIPEAIKGVGGGEKDLVLGDLDKNKVSVTIPKGSFDEDIEVTLVSPEEVPGYSGSIMDPMGAPFEISIPEGQRLNEKAIVTFKFDPAKLPTGDEIYQMRVGYFNGEEWEYVKAQEVDKEKGLITFETYHFCLLGSTKVKDETKLVEDWAHSQALDKVMRDEINNTSDFVASQIIDMTLEKMGINDKTLKGKVLNDLLKSDSYREIYNEYEKGDMVAMNQKIALLAGEKIASNVPSSVFSDALGNVVSGADDVAAVSKAAGYAAEGQYKDAAKIIGEQIADKFLITTAGKIAVEMVDHQIQSWKNSEVEAAFEAYKNGADGVFWGYNVDPGDFDGIWLQMRGIRRQIELEAIKKENDQREEAGMPALSEKQEERIRNSLKESYRKQFAERVKQEEKMEKIEKDLKILAEAFQDRDMFSDTLGPNGLNKGYDFEQKLNILNKFAEKIMRDTGRTKISDEDVTLKEGYITAKSIALGASIYLSEPDGKKRYKEYLESNFGISPYPDLKELKGKWSGTITITDVYIAEDLKEKGNVETEEGECDLDINLEDLVGKANPFSMVISPTSESGGNMTIGVGDEDDKVVPFTYSDGVINAPLNEEGATGSFSLNVTKTDSGYSADGAANLSYAEGQAKITASIATTKGN